MKFDRFSVLTFDCYGTLIDWETGILGAIHGVLKPRGIERADDELLTLFGELESPIQFGTFRRYREVLDLTMGELCRRLGFAPTLTELTAISRSLPEWRPFPDTVAALKTLATRYQLGVISNVDDDLFEGSARQLGVKFDWVVTAQQARSYKPSLNNFRHALQQIGKPWDQVLHCAQSLFHDVGPAKSLGLATVWVNRRAGKPGAGATPPSTAKPDLVVDDMATLARLATAD